MAQLVGMLTPAIDGSSNSISHDRHQASRMERDMAGTRVWTFFYGSFINRDVLRQLDVVPDQVEVGRLGGFDIVIRPLANLVQTEQHSVYGILAAATHDELGRLYDYARNGLGGIYLPEAVLVQTLAQTWRPALCYIAPELEPREPTNDYIDRIVIPARQHGFPGWYIDRLEGFRPPHAFAH
jgi:hypothetical protein